MPNGGYNPYGNSHFEGTGDATLSERLARVNAAVGFFKLIKANWKAVRDYAKSAAKDAKVKSCCTNGVHAIFVVDNYYEVNKRVIINAALYDALELFGSAEGVSGLWGEALGIHAILGTDVLPSENIITGPIME